MYNFKKCRRRKTQMLIVQQVEKMYNFKNCAKLRVEIVNRSRLYFDNFVKCITSKSVWRVDAVCSRLSHMCTSWNLSTHIVLNSCQVLTSTRAYEIPLLGNPLISFPSFVCFVVTEKLYHFSSRSQDFFTTFCNFLSHRFSSMLRWVKMYNFKNCRKHKAWMLTVQVEEKCITSKTVTPRVGEC